MKFVYVVVGKATNIFVEQAWVSIWSLKHYNPKATICVVTDDETMVYIDALSEMKKLVDEFYTIHFGQDVLPMIRSRWLKTKMREIVRGDIIYIDSDTIITGDLSGLSEGYENIGMVLDMHVPFSNHPYKKLVSKIYKKVYNTTPSNCDGYYNGGFMCSKDTQLSHVFFEKWHNNWLECRKKGITIDQISLLKTSISMPRAISPLSGIYNCQLSYSIQYLYEAKIMHYQRMDKRIGSEISPFYDNDIYQRVRDDNHINLDVQKIVLGCKSCISSPSITLTEKEFRLFHSKFFSLLKLFAR